MPDQTYEAFLRDMGLLIRDGYAGLYRLQSELLDAERELSSLRTKLADTTARVEMLRERYGRERSAFRVTFETWRDENLKRGHPVPIEPEPTEAGH